MDGYRMFCKDRQGIRRGGVDVVYVKENFEYAEVNYDNCGSPCQMPLGQDEKGCLHGVSYSRHLQPPK